MRLTRHKTWLGGLALVTVLALPPSVSEAGQPRGSVRLTDGRTVAHWAHTEHIAAVRRHPSQGAKRVARTHFLTEDGLLEVYPVLRRYRDRHRQTWLRIRIPMRPNGRTGWVRASALGPLYRVRTRLVVDRRSLRATLFRSGHRIWRSAVGVGKAGTPTPGGNFWIREKFKVPNSGGLYGPRAFGTGAYSRLSDWPGGGVIGIHGTDEPNLIPGRPSHGCVRVPNAAVSRLYRLMPIGTPLQIR